MRLTLEDGSEVDNPSAEAISATLAQVDDQANSYAILESSQANYIQIAGDPAAGFVVEYHTASPEGHYQLPAPASFEQAVWLFQSYARGDDAWRTVVQWQPVDF